MLHDQNYARCAAPATPRILAPHVWIYVQALGIIVRRIDRAERHKRDALRQNHCDHRRQELAAVTPQHEQSYLVMTYVCIYIKVKKKKRIIKYTSLNKSTRKTTGVHSSRSLPLR